MMYLNIIKNYVKEHKAAFVAGIVAPGGTILIAYELIKLVKEIKKASQKTITESDGIMVFDELINKKAA